ncbi:MAG: integron integrase, partial [Gammaproteobacteria bacterium]
MPSEHRGWPFLDQVRNAIRVRHYSIRTEEAYLGWIKGFILFHGERHPREMAEPEVSAFLTYLAVEGRVAAATENQALNALVFLYKVVLECPLGEIEGVARAKKPQRLPVVLTADEVRGLLRHLSGSAWLVACLLYGSGLRLMEALRLRVKDLDFAHGAVLVRDGKGGKDRVVTLPDGVIAPLRQHLEHVRLLHDKDIADGFGAVVLPYALERKYPNAPREWHWQYVFPSANRSIDPRSGVERRHHLHASSIQKAIRTAVRRAGVQKPASCHALRHYAACGISGPPL